ncbi:MAG: hypothetical protein KC416_06675 [Myxococcales bacterium]|nr:hypothetical protein [Myxococcales bacterium]
MYKWIFGTACVLFLCGLSGRVEAQKLQKFDRSLLIFEAHGAVGWYGEIGGGFRVEIPVILDIAKGVDDDLRASVGGDFRWFFHPRQDGFGGYPVAAAQWNFYVNPRWSFFPEAGLAGVFAPDRKYFWRSFIAPLGGVGARYHFASRNALVMRINWPTGFQAGVTF